ncbi:MAG: DNA-binding response regulator [Acidobacteriales bacterium 59-55]|nr:response regulator transcription factor [Terriglobales bacterium]OJV40176.1 MAG: DNA-binding response regulator [Acidobacteriales bacterium 59-55]
MRLKALIADDEPLARERLRLLLASDPDVSVTSECRNGKEVIAALNHSTFDVLFLDIQMPGRGGFEVLQEVDAERRPATIFVTAHNQYAVQAFEVNALDYLTKPVELSRLQATLARVKDGIASRSPLNDPRQWQSVLAYLERALSARSDYPKRLLVPNGSKDIFVAVDDIDWIEAADYYACLHVGPKRHMIRETIKDLAQTLDPQKFVRIHRSVIVNATKVSEIFREGRGEGVVVLVNGERLRMSKGGWHSLLAISHK